jgi:hypothetical protein
MKKKMIIGALSVLAILLFAFAGIRIADSVSHNNRLKSTFSYGVFAETDARAQYRSRKPLEEIDLLNLAKSVFPAPVSDLTTPFWGAEDTLVLLSDIQYYRKENGNYVKDILLQKGKRVEIKSYELSYVLGGPGYGFYSLPAYDAGWRIVKPFTVSGEGEDSRFLYVRFSDLRKNIEAVKDTSYYKEALAYYKDGNTAMAESIQKLPETMLLELDQRMFDNHVDISPYLLKNTWDAFTILLLGVGIVLCGAAVFIAFRKEKK